MSAAAELPAAPSSPAPGPSSDNTPRAKSAAEASIDEVLAQVASTRGMVSDFEDKWAAFQRRFDEIVKTGLSALAGELGPEPEPTADERAAPFGGGAPTAESVCSRLAAGEFRDVVVLLGAGVSVSAGIPDFRTPGTGLYDNLQEYGLPTPQSAFDLEYYRSNPEPFVRIAAEMWPGKARPTPAHRLVKVLADRGWLRRVYTQNIDGLEREAGVPEDLLVEVHGGFRAAHCAAEGCGAGVPLAAVKEAIVDRREAPACPTCGGVAKPAVVFFGEQLPARFAELSGEDMERCDLLIVMGTSLAVAPVSALPQRVGMGVPRVLVNKEVVGSRAEGTRRGLRLGEGEEDNYRDVALLGDCDDGVRRMAEMMGLEESCLGGAPPSRGLR